MLSTDLRDLVKPYANRNRYGFPSDEINPKLKNNPDWYLANCKGIVCDYGNNLCHTPFDFVGEENYSYEILDMYAQGKQGNGKIKKVMLNPEKIKNGTGYTRMNVRWDCPKVMPKMFDVIRSIQQRIDYRVEASSIDPSSVNARNLDRAMMKFILDESTKHFLEFSRFKPNVPVDPRQIGLMNDAQVDLFYDCGGVVIDIEIMAQIVCETTKLLSGFKNIHDQVNDDLIKYAFACGEHYMDPNTFETKLDWINPKHAIVPKSDYLDFRDITHYAYLKFMTLGDLRERTELNNTQIMYLLRKFQNINPGLGTYLDNIGNYAGVDKIYSNHLGIGSINKVRVPVLKCQWLSCDYNFYLNSPRADEDTPMFKEVEFGYRPTEKDKNKKGEKAEVYKDIRKHEALWVLGTETLIEYGPTPNTPKYGNDGEKTPRLNLKAIQTGNQSLVSRCISHIDDLHEATIKRRQAIKSIPPAPRMVVMKQLLQNVIINKKKLSPKDIITGFTEDGVMILDGVDDFGKSVFQSGNPIQFLPTGVGEDIIVFSNEINNSINLMRDVLGLNSAMDGSDPKPRDGARRTELAQDSANNAIFPTFNKYKDWYENIFTDVIRSWQIGGQLKPIKVSFNRFGQRTQYLLELTKEFCLADFNIKVEMVWSEEEKERMIANLVALKAQRVQNGSGGITESDYLMLEEMVNSGNVKLAKFMLAQVEQWRAIADREIARENERLNNENAAAAGERVEKAKQKTIMLQESEKRKTEALKKALDIKGDVAKALISKEQIPGQTDGYLTSINAEADQIITMSLAPQFREEEAVAQQEQGAMEEAQMAQMLDQAV